MPPPLSLSYHSFTLCPFSVLAGHDEAGGGATPSAELAPCVGPSLDVAAAAGASLGVRAVGLRGQGLVERVQAGVGGQGISPRWHPLVDAIQALGFLKAGDLVLGREAFDGCWGVKKGERG